MGRLLLIPWRIGNAQDLTKRTRGKYPLADKVLSMTCERWLKALPAIPWDRVSDLALMVGP